VSTKTGEVYSVSAGVSVSASVSAGDRDCDRERQTHGVALRSLRMAGLRMKSASGATLHNLAECV
jgi:hypothetical protein